MDGARGCVTAGTYLLEDKLLLVDEGFAAETRAWNLLARSLSEASSMRMTGTVCIS